MRELPWSRHGLPQGAEIVFSTGHFGTENIWYSAWGWLAISVSEA